MKLPDLSKQHKDNGFIQEYLYIEEYNPLIETGEAKEEEITKTSVIVIDILNDED